MKNIEDSIVPFKIADLVRLIAQKKNIDFESAMFYFYQTKMSKQIYDPIAKWWYFDTETLYKEMEIMQKQQVVNRGNKELLFVVFCVERWAKNNKKSSISVFLDFEKLGVIHFLFDNYDVLHSQGEDYIMEEIELFIKQGRGI